jgi:peptidoglycan/xylan/chitin deacetylase (PgdA/CDA1 family)
MRVTQKLKVPILTYHSIDKSGSVISTAPDVFRRQMRYLSENRYNAVTLHEFISSLSEDNTPFLKTVVLTFDDGFQNFFSEAFPVLEEYGFRATVFLVTDFCGKKNDWAGNPPALPPSKILSWEEIKELHKYGIEFGGHTRTHPDLTKIPDSRAEREIVESKAAIENFLGSQAASFAYPFGKFNASVKRTVEKSYKAACSTNLGKVRSGSDFFSLERVDTYYLSNPKVFNRLASQSFDGYMLFRQMMRDFKAFVTRN